jgi:cytochrome P450
MHGLDFITGEYRKKLRAALNVGFTTAAVRNYRPVFEKAAQAVRLIFRNNCDLTACSLPNN